MAQSQELSVLTQARFGNRTAEEERDNLSSYFVETPYWLSVFDGSTDIIYGSKGSGKSAIYNLLLSSENILFDRRILVTPGENPQGAPAFAAFNDQGRGEKNLLQIWKLYILSICGNQMRQYHLTSTSAAKKLMDVLASSDLIPADFNLTRTLRRAFDYIRRLSFEPKLSFDPSTGVPNAVSAKISLSEPSSAAAKAGVISIESLFVLLQEALQEHDFAIWILLDRLDVAFANEPEIEQEALRALFRCYRDMSAYRNIKLKIFLRSDIWSRITSEGMREASHIERALTLEWTPESLINLVLKRILANRGICDLLQVEPRPILSDLGKQREMFEKLFPRTMVKARNATGTFEWILERLSDATGKATPREIIHLLNEVRTLQVMKFQIGTKLSIEDGCLFSRSAVKEACFPVSKARLEQTIYAEYPEFKPLIERLRKRQTRYRLTDLRNVWRLSETDTFEKIERLEEIGFLGKAGHVEWRIPFLYRPALELPHPLD
jgi:hypothetical protein